ncbi:MAG: ATP-binding protein [Candidatus Onthomonas sp.]|nr:ATP-binding protein [Candidatus Onthomonas sp.]
MSRKQTPPLFQAPGLSYAARQLITKLFFRSLTIYLLLDALIYLLLGGSRWSWWLIFAAEAVALVLSLQKNTDMVRRMFTPIRALEETADALNSDQVDTETLRRLAERLDEITVSSLKTSRIQIPAGQEEMSALANAINAMLERIDRGYQAQARFVSDASHELRTPISVIQGYANMLDRWGKDDPEVRQEAINAIRAEAASMGTLVEQLLFLARGDNNTQVVRKQCVDLSDLADEVYRETQLLETGRVIQSAIQPGVLFWGDPGLLKQALRILVDNGVKYTPEGGSVTIRLRAEEGRIRLSVTDTGAGIAQEELPRVFERFYRSDQSRARETGGTGLGLPIAKWIAARHNGWIEVVSKPEVGSRFTLLLPWDQPPEKTEETAKP